MTTDFFARVVSLTGTYQTVSTMLGLAAPLRFYGRMEALNGNGGTVSILSDDGITDVTVDKNIPFPVTADISGMKLKSGNSGDKVVFIGNLARA